MTERYSGWRALRGDLDRLDLVDEGKRMLGHLDNQKRLSGNQSAYMTRTMSDGSVIKARWDGNLPSIHVQGVNPDGSESQDESILMYTGSNNGLVILDLGTKTIKQTITGLEPYMVEAVHKKGAAHLVYMSRGQLAARVDLVASTAFSKAYDVKYVQVVYNNYSLLQTGVAAYMRLMPSPDASRVLIHFSNVAVVGAGSLTLKDAVGGFLMCNGATLDKIKGPIRMGSTPGIGAWREDGEVCYTTATLTADRGDVEIDPNDLFGPAKDLADITQSLNDYVAEYDREGNLLGTTLVATWADPSPSTYAGFTRAISAMCVEGHRLYVVANPNGFDYVNSKVFVYNIENTSPTLLTSYVLATGLEAVRSIAVRNGVLYGAGIAGRVLQINVDPASDEEGDVTVDTTYAITTGTGDKSNWRSALQLAPKECTTEAAKRMKFIAAYTGDVAGNETYALHGFQAFDNEHTSNGSYNFAWTVKAPWTSASESPPARYCLIYGGPRAPERKAA